MDAGIVFHSFSKFEFTTVIRGRLGRRYFELELRITEVKVKKEPVLHDWSDDEYESEEESVADEADPIECTEENNIDKFFHVERDHRGRTMKYRIAVSVSDEPPDSYDSGLWLNQNISTFIHNAKRGNVPIYVPIYVWAMCIGAIMTKMND